MNKWKEGHWKFTINGTVLKILKLAGDELWEEDGTLWMKIKFLPSGSAELIDNATCNLELYWAIFQRQGHGVVTEDGHRIMLDNDGTLDWISEEEYMMMNDKDPANDIPNTYKYKKDDPGKILWLCGPTGIGKTTTAKILQADEGFIYYEGDCFILGLNPYVGASPKGAMQFGTKALSGIPQERTDVCRLTLTDGYTKLRKGEEVDEKIWEDFYELLCQDILREREKLGGKWVVAQAVYTRSARDIVRRKMGDDLIIVVLETDEDDLQIERLAKRAAKKEGCTKDNLENSKKKMASFVGYHDTVEDDEPNTFKVLVSGDMSAENVAKKVHEKYLSQGNAF